MAVKGYKLNHRQLDSTSVCSSCANKIPLNTNGDNVSELTTKNYGTFHCLVCEEDITRGGGSKTINYPSEIANLFEKSFEDRGPRFGGVNPIIKSAGKEEEKLSDHAKKVEPVTSSHDPVLVEVRSKDLANDIHSMINTLSKNGRIRGVMNEIEDEDGDVVVYEFEIFANQ